MRTVVLAGRTLQALARLHYDLAPLLVVDHRIRVLYALSEGSPRQRFAERRAKSLGISLFPWQELHAERPDLVVSASATPELYDPGALVALLPHGATYNRLLEGLSGAAGTAREQVLGAHGQIPALMAMPGASAIGQLARDCPEALPAAEVTGDLCMERLRISTPLRALYREALGVGSHQNLIVVSSTWGPYSLSAVDRSLPGFLLSHLPADEFAVAYLPHPNLDADHDGTLLAHLRPLLRNGLIMTPAEEGWRAALIAADCVVGDAGSVTFYAANLGKPVRLAAFGFQEMAPGSPQEAFGALQPRLQRGSAPASQLREAIADKSVSAERSAILAEAWFEEDPGPAARILRRLYELLDLAPDLHEPEMLDLPERLEVSLPVSAWHCDVTIEDGVAEVVRYPASAPVSTVLGDAAHLVVTEGCLVRALRADAAVLLFHQRTRSSDEGRELLTEALANHPRCAIASVRIGPDHSLVVCGDGRQFAVRGPETSLMAAPSVLLNDFPAGAVPMRLGAVRTEAWVERVR